MNEDMTLKDQISRFTAAMAERTPREVIATLGAELKKLAASEIANARTGRRACARLRYLRRAGRDDRVGDVAFARGPVVVTFYPRLVVSVLRSSTARISKPCSPRSIDSAVSSSRSRRRRPETR